MDHIDKGDQITAGTHAEAMPKGGIRERSPNVPLTRPGGMSDVEWQEQQAHARQPGATAVLGEDEDDGTPDALLNKGGVSKGFDVAGLGNSSTS